MADTLLLLKLNNLSEVTVTSLYGYASLHYSAENPKQDVVNGDVGAVETVLCCV